ncbi:hypothetical protein KR222_005740 [Zaprionus bogoriensis]|nr:hypothetical protein KR222_005740 [Zaprionus bogoriensis]
MELRWLPPYILVFISALVAMMLPFGHSDQPEPRRCSYGRIEKLMRIRCYDMNLKEVPQNLKTSVEVLDLSYNRIRKLKQGSFERYSDVKFLMLYENMILTVEPGTFAPLSALQVSAISVCVIGRVQSRLTRDRDRQEIDLSNNGLTTIPMELFQMPRLRNLYMDSNVLRDLHEELQQLEKPIRAPLEYLNVANCELHDIPDLGILPNLWQLNASANPLDELSVDRLGNLCHLSVIDLTRTQMRPCSCQQVTNHLMVLGANPKFVPLCVEALDSNACPLPYNRTVDSPTFLGCVASAELAETRSFWTFAAGCFGGAALVLILFCYCILRWRKRRKNCRLSRTIQNRKHLVISPRNATNHRLEDEPLHCDTA